MTLKAPMVIVNFKNYANAVGRLALELTEDLEGAAGRQIDHVAVCPSLPDTSFVAAHAEMAVLAQHCDGVEPGSTTGHVTADALSDWGVAGSLINHAERQVEDEAVALAVDRLTQAGLTSIVCTSDEAATRRLAALNPTMVAVEPPELIGGNVSVTTADPDIVARSVAAAGEVSECQVLCGAGVKTGKDVAAALELGTVGVLVASGVVKAEDPAAALGDLLDGLGLE